MGTGVSCQGPGAFAQIANLFALVLSKTDQMTGTRGAIFTFRTDTSETRHPVAFAAFVAYQKRDMRRSAQRMRRISGLRIAAIIGAGDLRGIVDDSLIILTAAAVGGKRWEMTIRTENALALMIPRGHTADAGYRVAACLRSERGRALVLIADAAGVDSLTAQEASTSSRASFSIGGSSFPRRSARRRIPSQALLLK